MRHGRRLVVASSHFGCETMRCGILDETHSLDIDLDNEESAGRLLTEELKGRLVELSPSYENVSIAFSAISAELQNQKVKRNA